MDPKWPIKLPDDREVTGFASQNGVRANQVAMKMITRMIVEIIACEDGDEDLIMILSALTVITDESQIGDILDEPGQLDELGRRLNRTLTGEEYVIDLAARLDGRVQ